MSYYQIYCLYSISCVLRFLQLWENRGNGALIQSFLLTDKHKDGGRGIKLCSNTWPAVAILRLCPSRALMNCLPRCTLMSPHQKLIRAIRCLAPLRVYSAPARFSHNRLISIFIRSFWQTHLTKSPTDEQFQVRYFKHSRRFIIDDSVLEEPPAPPTSCFSITVSSSSPSSSSHTRLCLANHHSILPYIWRSFGTKHLGFSSFLLLGILLSHLMRQWILP